MLVFGMVWVVNVEREGVAEDRRRLFEANAMLGEVPTQPSQGPNRISAIPGVYCA